MPARRTAVANLVMAAIAFLVEQAQREEREEREALAAQEAARIVDDIQASVRIDAPVDSGDAAEAALPVDVGVSGSGVGSAD